jgi:membrane-associated protein
MNWFDPSDWLSLFGSFAVIGVAILIYVETATIVGSILPGDSLLFLLGMTLASALDWFPLPVALLLVFVAAVLGAETGYSLGRRFGRRMFTREKAWFFTPRTVEHTEQLLERYGARALIFTRFVPVVRAVTPLFAGIAHFPRTRFTIFNIIGGLVWAIGLTLLGYLLGMIPFVHDHFETVILAFVILSSLPMPIELLRERLKKRS